MTCFLKPLVFGNNLDISFQSLKSGALYGGVLEQCVKIGFRQVLPIVFTHGDKPFRRLELRLHVGQRKAVVRTRILADVAAIHPTMEGLRVMAFKAAFVFDGQVGDAFARVDMEWRFQGTRGTGVDAFRAASATVVQGLAGGLQFQRQE